MPLTNWQEFVSKAFPGKGAQPTQEQLEQLAQQFFGNIPLPPGVDESMVTKRTGGYVEWKDKDGYVHRLERVLDGRSPNAGQVIQSEQTNRPAIGTQSAAGEQDAAKSLLQQLMDIFNQQAQQRQSGQQPNTKVDEWLESLRNLTNRLSQPTALASLDPATEALLDQISNAEQMQLNQLFDEGQGNLIARLFGQGINRSSMAGDQAARLLQEQGLVQAQQQSNSAQRNLAIRQFLSQLGQGNLALASQNALGGGGLALDEFTRLMQNQQQQQGQLQGFLSDLLNQALGRETSNAQFDLANRQFRDSQRRNEQNFQQQYIQWQEQQRELQRANMWNNIFRGVGIGASFIPGIGSLFSGLGSGSRGGSGGGYRYGGQYIGE